jgi:hypothetical protein
VPGDETPFLGGGSGAGTAPGIGSTAYTQNLDDRLPLILSKATSVGFKAAALVALSFSPLMPLLCEGPEDAEALGAAELLRDDSIKLSSVLARLCGGGGMSSICVSGGAPKRVERRSPRHSCHEVSSATRLLLALTTTVRVERLWPCDVVAARRFRDDRLGPSSPKSSTSSKSSS